MPTPDGIWLVCQACSLRSSEFIVWQDSRSGRIEVQCRNCRRVLLTSEPASPTQAVGKPVMNPLQPVVKP